MLTLGLMLIALLSDNFFLISYCKHRTSLITRWLMKVSIWLPPLPSYLIPYSTFQEEIIHYQHENSWRRKSFQKNASYDNIKKQKNKGFNLSPENTLLQKPQWAVKLTSPGLFRVNPASDWIFVITSDLLYTF